MGKPQILFSQDDPVGAASSVTENLWNHLDNRSSSWGSDKHTRKLFPRGKVYHKIHERQFEQLVGGFEEDI